MAADEKRIPIATVKIKVTANREESLQIFENQSIEKVVAQFCEKWMLSPAIQQALEYELYFQLGGTDDSVIDEENESQESIQSNPLFFFPEVRLRRSQ